MTRRNTPLTHCKRGHEFTLANTIWRQPTMSRLCRECEEMRRQARAKRNLVLPNPSESGWCRKRRHKWIEANWWYDQQGYAHCILCRRAAARELYHRNHSGCIVKGCERVTAGDRSRAYICPKHRKDPPAWIFRAGLRIVGTEVVAA